MKYTSAPANILEINSLSFFSKIFEFQKELDEDFNNRKRIFFDSSSIIAMVAGPTDMFFYHRFRRPAYQSLQTLLLACVYQSWLGQIELLPPHLQEFIEKRENPRLFPNELDEALRVDIWHNLGFDALSNEDVKKNPKKLRELYKYEKIKNRAVDYFKMIYLTKHLFWKKRLHHLMGSAKPIFKISEFEDYDIHGILHHPLFRRIKNLLDIERSIRPKNNYIDAIALCFLQQLLDRFNADKNNPAAAIPLFFADDNVITRVVDEVSKTKIDGRFPFVYEGRSGSNLVVQDANFFFIDAIFQAGKDLQLFGKFEEFIAQFRQWAKDSESAEKMESNQEHSLGLKKDTQTIVFLKFIKHWWDDKGLEKIQYSIEDYYKDLEIKLPKIDKQFEEVKKKFEEDLNRVRDQMKKTKETFDILSDSYDVFQSLKNDFRTKFPDRDNLNYDTFNEFASRFSFSPACCVRLSNLIKKVNSQISDHEEAIESLKADIITDLLFAVKGENLLEASAGMVEEAFPGGNNNKKINLYAALGLLWTLEKYTLLEKICDIVRQKYSAIDAENVYPDYQLAILHAAAILKNPLDLDIAKAKKILQCVEDKFAFENYKVWISLSYGYYLLWKREIKRHTIPELQLKENADDYDLRQDHLSSGLEFAKQAVLYLEDKIDQGKAGQEKDTEKLAFRNRRFYYALNNYVYFETMTISPKMFDDLWFQDLVSMLEEADEKGFGQARFKDTCARYYQRKAALLMINHNFDSAFFPTYYDLMDISISLTEKAIKEAREAGIDDVNIFENLLRELKVKMKGESGIRQLQKLVQSRSLKDRASD